MSNRVYADGILISGTGSPGNRVYADGILMGGILVATITHTKSGTFVLTMKGTNGAVIYCDPGDGSAVQEKTLLGSISVYFSYDNDGTSRTVRLFGEIDKIEYIYLYAMSISAIDLTYIESSSFYHLTIGLNQISNLDAINQLSDTVTWINFNGNPIVYTERSWFTTTSGTFYFSSTVKTSGEVDQWLIDLNAANWSNCMIYLVGTNPAPTAASAAALAGLASRGCTVYTN
jgi:hypothetical protein